MFNSIDKKCKLIREIIDDLDMLYDDLVFYSDDEGEKEVVTKKIKIREEILRDVSKSI